MYLIRMLVICQKICSVTIEVWPYATSGLSFWHRKAAGEPKGDTAPLETVFWDSFWEVGNLQKTRKG